MSPAHPFPARPLPARPGAGAASRRRAEMLRVDHAGELAAVHIYRGQRAVLGGAAGREAIAGQVAAMETQEAAHLARFDAILTGERVRPSLLAPLWRVAGFTLGAGTALLGEKAALACTEAVETVIEAHYAGQIEEIGQSERPGDADLAAELTRFRDDELAHRDEARAGGARQAPLYPLLTAVIRTGCRAAIGLAEKI